MAKRKLSDIKLSSFDDMNMLQLGTGSVNLTLILAKKQVIKMAQNKNCIFLRMLWYGAEGIESAVPITIFGL